MFSEEEGEMSRRGFWNGPYWERGRELNRGFREMETGRDVRPRSH